MELEEKCEEGRGQEEVIKLMLIQTKTIHPSFELPQIMGRRKLF